MNAKSRKLQVFVSSTYEDLKEERQAAVQAILNAGESLEKKNKEVGSKVLELENPDKFREFKKFVMSKMVRPWDDLKDIRLVVFESLAEFSKREELIGWVRGDQVVNSGALAEELARLGKENSELRSRIEELNRLTGDSNFSTLFDLLQTVKIETDGLKEYFPVFKSSQMKMVDANTHLLLTYDHIDGINKYPFELVELIFSHFQKFNLIEISEEKFLVPSPAALKQKKFQVEAGLGLDIHDMQWEHNYVPKFTNFGINYLLYLRREHPGLII